MRFLLTFLIFTSPLSAGAQTLQGVVTDGDSSERLNGATVFVPSLNLGTATNAFGAFALRFPAGTPDSVAIEVRFVGYAPLYATVALDGAASAFKLAPASDALGDVTVRADSERGRGALAAGSVRLTAAEVEQLPAFLGEADPLKAIQLFPSVHAGSEGSSGVHIRGGSPDQTLLLLDGAPVYNASHLVGVVSVFNTDALQSVALTAGAPAARYGGRLSGVVDVASRDGSRERVGGTATVGLLASRALVEGPAFGDAGSFLVSGRRTYADLLARPLLFSDGAAGGYAFQDLNARATLDLGARTRLVGGLYTGSDRYYHRLSESFDTGESESMATELGWGNTTATLRAASALSPRVFASALVLGSRYRFAAERSASITYPPGSNRTSSAGRFEQSSGLGEVSARVDIEATLHPDHTLGLGASVERRGFDPSRVVREGSAGDADTSGAPRVATTGGSAYLSDALRFGARASADIGLRGEWSTTETRTWAALQPRLRFSTDVGRGWSVGASGGKTWQPLHLLTNAGIGLPTDLWVPPSSATPPASAWQGALEASRTLGGGWAVSLAGFAKHMENLVEYRDGAGFFSGSADASDDLVTGRGRAGGVEVLARKTGGRTDGWLSYALSRSTRSFDAIDGGETFPYRYDRTHDLSAAVTHRLSARRRLSALFVYATGAAVTVPVARYGGGFGFGTPVYSSRNGARLPAYHRFDLSYEVDYGRGRLALGLYNVYNRLNPYFVEPAVEYDPATQQERDGFRRVSLLPILPSVSYRFAF